MFCGSLQGKARHGVGLEFWVRRASRYDVGIRRLAGVGPSRARTEHAPPLQPMRPASYGVPAVFFCWLLLSAYDLSVHDYDR